MAKVSLNFSKIDQAAVSAFKDTCLLLGQKCTEVISEPGVFDGFPQDIVDTGRLRAAQQLQFLSDSEAQLSWDVEYALALHEGATFKAGESWQQKEHWRKMDKAFGKAIPARSVKVAAHTVTRREARTVDGRPWTKEAQKRLNPQTTFLKLLAARLK